MITFWKKIGDRLHKTAILEQDCWIEVTAPTDFEKETLEREYGIPVDFIQDVLDPDERPRMEKDGKTLFLIYRVPIFSSEADIRYSTIPTGLVLSEKGIITICAKECSALSELTQMETDRINLKEQKHFILTFMLHAAKKYLGFLKVMNQQTALIEEQLQQAVRNNELIRLLRMEKSLVYFTTSLRGNELLTGKIQKNFLKDLNETEEELLDDLTTETTQALEMSNIYSNILSGMMDAFASVISNNLNMVLKRLTLISIVLMIPTLFASIYGMNIPLPFQHSLLIFPALVVISIVTSAAGAVFFAQTGPTIRNPKQKSRKAVKL